MGLNSKHSMSKWEFIAYSQGAGWGEVGGWKITKGKYKDKRDSC